MQLIQLEMLSQLACGIVEPVIEPAEDHSLSIETGSLMSNVARMKRLYEAFRDRDVETILKGVREDVQWQYGGATTKVPWLMARHGRSGVLDYLKSFSEVDVKLVPKIFLEQGNVVVVLLDVDIVVKANGMKIHEEDAPHVVYFDEGGLIEKFRSRADTAEHEKAYYYRPASPS